MILLIDLYDSFTNNLSQLIAQTTGLEVIIIHNDTFPAKEYDYFFTSILPLFQYVVVGPGPGHPANAKDIGIVAELYNRKFDIPILGICLGFQSLCHEFGNQVQRLNKVRHGQIYSISPLEKCAIFHDLIPFDSVRYHSLFVDISSLSSEIIPLATCNDDGTQVLMAGRHRELPYFGVQYHPESICSDRGDDLLKNFNEFAQEYNKSRTILENSLILDEIKLSRAVYEKNLVNLYNLPLTESQKSIVENSSCLLFELDNDAISVCDSFHQEKTPFYLLHSASQPGQWTIIGLPDETSEIISHSLDSPNSFTVSTLGSEPSVQTLKPGETVWLVFGRKMESKYIPRALFQQSEAAKLPFLGGYLGLVSYEEGRFINVDKLEPFCENGTPDFKLVYIDRFIVFDNVSKKWYVMSIRNVSRQENSDWCESMVSKLSSTSKLDLATIPCVVQELDAEVPVQYELPSEELYSEQFDKCQELLHSGDSYELCLTAALKIKLSSKIDPWDIYKILVLRKNPSPYSCFISFDDVTLISTSPERFLSWKDDLENPDAKLVELRPIKGTVKNTESMTFAKATELLKTAKEMGENLMIVDLIRHDLHQFTKSVKVRQLMSVEEYKTVFQLVSVIQGTLEADENGNRYHGLDVLSDSLPPGSMTGAPKKRSVELLQDIESLQNTSMKGGRRGIYSGVVGYWSITDDSDWSVIIRSLFHYTNDKENNDELKLWRIGAGGAITVLSDKEGEWNEMYVKLNSTLQAFK